MYVNQDVIEEKMKQLSNLHYVRKVEPSYRPEIDMTFKNSLKQLEEENKEQIEES